jgi:hypothetical protein
MSSPKAEEKPHKEEEQENKREDDTNEEVRPMQYLIKSWKSLTRTK